MTPRYFNQFGRRSAFHYLLGTLIITTLGVLASSPLHSQCTAEMEISGGDGQIGVRNSVFDTPLTVHVTCAGDGDLSNAAVVFSVSDGGLAEDPNVYPEATITIYSDENGSASVYLFLPDEPAATVTVTASVQLGSETPATVQFGAATKADSDDDGVPDSEDGWYLHPQITSPPVADSNYVVIDLGEGIPYGMNNLNEVVGERLGGAEYYDEAFLFELGTAPVSLGFLTNDPSIPNINKKSIAYAINDDGVITGEATYSWDPNVSGDFPDPPVYPILNTYNDGTSYSQDNYDTHAFRWENGVMTDAGDLSWSLPPTTDHPNISNKGTSLGYAINNSGTIAGTSDYDVQTGGGGWYWEIQTQGPHAASFPGGTDAVDINMSTYYSEGYGINDFGAIVGYCSGDGTVDDRAFLVDGATVGFLGSARSGAYGIAINNFYHAIGDFGIGGYNSLYADDALHLPPLGGPSRRGSTSGNRRSGGKQESGRMLLTDEAPEDHVIDLDQMAVDQGYDDSLATAINDHDQIVGNSDDGPLLWQNGNVKKLQDLVGQDSDWQMWRAADINESGVIAVNGYKTVDYLGHVLLLLPVEFIETTPALLDEDGAEVPNSTKPKLLPVANDMVEEPIAGQIPKVAYRVLKMKVPKEVLAGEKVKWSMTPRFTPQGESQPRFRGVWPTAHPDCFEAAPDDGYGFERISQEEGRTTIDSEGYFAVRFNLPPIGYNKARVKLEVERYPGASAEIDFEVPGVVVIDPGHGGSADLPGSDANHAVSPTNVKEKDLALSYGLALRDALKTKILEDELNVKVLMTRKVDENVAGTDRAHFARENGADVVFVIHFNSSNGSVRGTLEVRQLPSQVNLNEDFALIDPIVSSIVAATTPFDSGARKLDFFPRDTSVAFDPKLGNTTDYHPIRVGYCEVEFLDNAAVDVLLNTGSNAGAVKAAIVGAMRDGILGDLKSQPAAP